MAYTSGGWVSSDGGMVLPSEVFAEEDQFAVKERRGENVSRTSGMTSASRRLCLVSKTQCLHWVGIDVYAERMALGSFSAGEEVRISWDGRTKLTTRSASTESMKYRTSMLNNMLYFVAGDCG